MGSIPMLSRLWIESQEEARLTKYEVPSCSWCVDISALATAFSPTATRIYMHLENNAITDLAALVSNTAIKGGSYVYLQGNRSAKTPSASKFPRWRPAA